MHDELESSGKRAATACNSITKSNSTTANSGITANSIINSGRLSGGGVSVNLFEHSHEMPTLGCDHEHCGHVPPGNGPIWAMEEMEEYDTEALLAHVHHHF